MGRRLAERGGTVSVASPVFVPESSIRAAHQESFDNRIRGDEIMLHRKLGKLTHLVVAAAVGLPGIASAQTFIEGDEGGIGHPALSQIVHKISRAVPISD